ncbi:MAG: hypothetical protein ACO3X2_08055, partial [Candidatus Nanopelagicales bacterium]
PPNRPKSVPLGEFATPPLGQQDHGAALWLTERFAQRQTGDRDGTPHFHATSDDGPDRSAL